MFLKYAILVTFDLFQRYVYFENSFCLIQPHPYLQVNVYILKYSLDENIIIWMAI